MTLKERITEDMKTAMRAGETAKRDAIRLLQAAIKQKEVDERIELDDTQVIAVMDKMVKQRRESITQYEAAGRSDLAGKEAPELAIIAQGDEVLDWREMVARYPKAQQIVQEGGEHALANFSDYLPRVTAFLRLA